VKRGLKKAGPFSRRKIWLIGIICVLLIATAVVLGGCKIVGYNMNSPGLADSDHLVTYNMRMATDSLQTLRGTVALRIPSAWDVISVQFAGVLSGNATYSANIVNYFNSVWEAKTPLDPGHNGPKNGYKWWAGYSPPREWFVDEEVQVTIHLNTHGRGGTYYLDFVTGWTTNANPAAETGGNRSNWEYGAQGWPANPYPGVRLDDQIILHCFNDVQPGHPFYTAIQGLGAAGIINGYGPQAGGSYEFRPANSVYRAQYTKFICNALNVAGVPGFTVAEGMTPPVNFPDLGPDNPADLYPHEYIWTAYGHNIIKGYLNGTFQPYIVISRQHVITMTVRALQGLAASPLTDPPPGYSGLWGGDMYPEHAANARIAEYNHLLDGIPLASGIAGMPRQEVAQIMWNMINLLTP
jgi:hypothetical protein